MKDPLEIAAAMKQGYGIICATCTRLVQDSKRTVSEGVLMRLCHEETCGGPLSGRDFPRYQGPITDFGRWCFVCGAASKYGATAPGTERRFGMCEEHVGMLRNIRAEGEDGRSVVTEVVDPQRGLVSLDRVVPRPQKTLLQAIAEAEAEMDA